MHVIGGLEIAEGVVGDHHGAVVLGQGCDGTADLGVKRVQIAGIAGRIRLIGGAALGIGGAEGCGDVLHIDLGIRHRLPGMGIMRAGVEDRLAVDIMVMAAARLLHRLDPVGQGDDGGIGSAGGDQAGQEALELQPVGQHHIGAGQRDRIGGARLMDMRVGIRADQHVQPDPVAADLCREIADDREGGDHVQRFPLRSRKGGKRDCRAGGDAKEPVFHWLSFHGVRPSGDGGGAGWAAARHVARPEARRDRPPRPRG